MNIRYFLISLLVLGAFWAPRAIAGISVRFAAPFYEVLEDEELTLDILIDGDDTAPGDQPVSHGLFSYGVKIAFEPANLETAADQVDVVSALNYTGFVPGALVELGEGYVLSKGNIALISATSPPYRGNALFTLTIQNRAPAGSRYWLNLESARATPTRTDFVDGLGNPLDEVVVFGATEVKVQSDSGPASPHLNIRLSSDGVIEISYDPEPGVEHYVQASSDLESWSDLYPEPDNTGTRTILADGGARFFRLRILSAL